MASQTEVRLRRWEVGGEVQMDFLAASEAEAINAGMAVRLMQCILLGRYQGCRHRAVLRRWRSHRVTVIDLLCHRKVSTARVPLSAAHPEGLGGDCPLCCPHLNVLFFQKKKKILHFCS